MTIDDGGTIVAFIRRVCPIGHVLAELPLSLFYSLTQDARLHCLGRTSSLLARVGLSFTRRSKEGCLAKNEPEGG